MDAREMENLIEWAGIYYKYLLEILILKWSFEKTVYFNYLKEFK